MASKGFVLSGILGAFLMASKLQLHFEAITQMRKRYMNFSQIANHLTAQGLLTKHQTLIKFYRQAIEKAKKIKQEVADLEGLLSDSTPQNKGSTSRNQPFPQSDNPAAYRSTVEGTDDPWKAKIIRPPKIKREPDKPKPRDTWDDFKIGRDVL